MANGVIDTLPDDTPHDVFRAVDLLEKRGYTVIPPRLRNTLVNLCVLAAGSAFVVAALVTMKYFSL